MPATDLPIAGRVINEVAWTTGGLWLRFWPPGPEYGLHIEGAFQIVAGGIGRRHDPRSPDATWFGLCGRNITMARAGDDGGLTIQFSDGSGLLVPPDEFEAWQLAGEDGELFVSVAGGGFAAWQRRVPPKG